MKINLLPQQYRPQPKVTFLNLIILLSGVILIIGIGFMAISEFIRFQSLTAETNRLQNQLDSYQQSLLEYEKFASIKQLIDKKHQEITKITELYQPIPKVLRTIAGAVPENLWLIKFSIAPDGKVTMDGQAILFSLVGDFLINLNQLPLVTASKLKSINQTGNEERDSMITYGFSLELQTGRSIINNAKN